MRQPDRSINGGVKVMTCQERLSASQVAAGLVVMRMRAIVVLFYLGPSLLAAPPEPAPTRPQRQLSTPGGVAASAEGAVRFLDQLRPTAETKKTVAELIEALGNESFVTRTRATRKLAGIGLVARDQLVSASEHSDLEVVLLTRQLLNGIEQTKQSGTHNALLSTALEILGREPHRDTAKTILQTIPLLESEHHFDQARVALWFATTRADQDRIRQALGQQDDGIRAAAIPALEVAIGAKAVMELRPYLSDRSDLIRLAAARALIDHLPLECLPVLVDLLDADRVAIRLRAAWLLSQVYDAPTDESKRKRLTDQVKLWKQHVADADRTVGKVPLGKKRLQLKEYPAIFREDFTRSTVYLIDRYGELRYEKTVAGAALRYAMECSGSTAIMTKVINDC